MVTDASSAVKLFTSAVVCAAAVAASQTASASSAGHRHPATSQIPDAQLADVVGARASRSLERHRVQVRALERSPSDAATCAVLASTQQARDAVDGALQERADARELPWLRDGASIAPGIAAAAGAEVVYVYIDYPELARLARGSSATLLNAAGQIWPAPSGQAVHWEQITDITMCSKPSALRQTLSDLRNAWPAAPACLRRLLAPALSQAIAEASMDPCVCRDEKDPAAERGSLASAARSLGLTTAVRRFARSEAAKQSAQRSCRPS